MCVCIYVCMCVYVCIYEVGLIGRRDLSYKYRRSMGNRGVSKRISMGDKST
jgi:hypothetical protein